MKTSALRHPEHSYFIRRHDWQIKALSDSSHKGSTRRTDIPHCAAELLSVLEFHYNNRFANRIFKQLVQAANLERKTALLDSGDWMPYSTAYLTELLLGARGSHVIGESLKALEEIGFISSDVPDDIPEFYSKNMSWYRLNVDFINDWIDTNIKKTWIENYKKPGHTPESIFGGREPDKRDPIEPIVLSPPADPNAEPDTKDLVTVASQVSAICQFYKFIHGKTKSYVFDDTRKGKVAKQLKAKRTIAQCAQAVIGNRLSDWHQAQHKDNHIDFGGVIYDDIGKHIFHNADKFERMVAVAVKNGVTEEIALRHFQAVLDGKGSAYAKKQPKTSDNTPHRDETIILHKPKVSDQMSQRYRDFSHAMASFFASGVTNDNIMELCREHDELKNAGDGLTDPEMLIENIMRTVGMFRPNGIEAELQQQISNFSKAFCRLQGINK